MTHKVDEMVIKYKLYVDPKGTIRVGVKGMPTKSELGEMVTNKAALEDAIDRAGHHVPRKQERAAKTAGTRKSGMINWGGGKYHGEYYPGGFYREVFEGGKGMRLEQIG